VETPDLASGSYLGTEPLTKVRISGQLGAGHLDGHGAPTTRSRQIYRPHAAGAQFPLHGVYADMPRPFHPECHTLRASPCDMRVSMTEPLGSGHGAF
jgi:hypothetical protein